MKTFTTAIMDCMIVPLQVSALLLSVLHKQENQKPKKKKINADSPSVSPFVITQNKYK